MGLQELGSWQLRGGGRSSLAAITIRRSQECKETGSVARYVLVIQPITRLVFLSKEWGRGAACRSFQVVPQCYYTEGVLLRGPVAESGRGVTGNQMCHMDR